MLTRGQMLTQGQAMFPSSGVSLRVASTSATGRELPHHVVCLRKGERTETLRAALEGVSGREFAYAAINGAVCRSVGKHCAQ